MRIFQYLSLYRVFLAIAFLVTTAVYWPGLQGTYLFDDYPNIVDNHGVQPHDTRISSLVQAALSSPSSEFKRPLASLSFAANYLATGLDPYWMKLTNLVIHLLNGWLVFLLTRALIMVMPLRTIRDKRNWRSACMTATWVAAGWMLLPINLTAVLYVVQRMESLANLFVLAGLIGYVTGRRRMLGLSAATAPAGEEKWHDLSPVRTRGFLLCLASILVPTTLGVLAKETAVMLPLYALLIEWMLFHFYSSPPAGLPDRQLAPSAPAARSVGCLQKDRRSDRRIITMFFLVLVIPMIAGLTWLVPRLLRSDTWAFRDFTFGTRLLSEARIVVDYIAWTLIPTPGALSFYHDDFVISSGLLTPWSTLASIVCLAALIALMFRLRSRQPLAALGIALFLGCQLLTGTIVPLELIFEHRNYFASFGLLLAIVPLLAAPTPANPTIERRSFEVKECVDSLPFALPRHVLLAGLMLCWTALTALTAFAWGNPLRLAEDLASRAPQSPRAQYELGRTYIIYSHYDPASPFTRLAYAPLERGASLPGASILPEQALIFMNARMHLPLKDAWWDSLIAKLKSHKPTVQDESSLGALTKCMREHACDLPKKRMTMAFFAALSHPRPSARLLAMYGDYAWNVLDDRSLGERMTAEAVHTEPNEAAYRVTLVRMLVVQGRQHDARQALQELIKLNLGGRLDDDIKRLQALPGLH
jgi:protein O-mannosyl-transferase